MSQRSPSFLFLIACACACSTVAPLPSTNECDSDLDCEKEGDVCAPDTRVCVPGSALPPRRDIAFEIQEADGFRVEIAGCDCDVNPNTATNEIAIVHRELQQTFQLDVFDDGDEENFPLHATFILSAANRFTATSPSAGITYPMNDGAEVDPQPVPTNVLWPRYHPYDALPPALADGGIVVWRTIPEDGAPVYRMLRPPQTNPKRTCTSDDECCDSMSSCANFCMPGVGECTVLNDPHFAYAYAYDRRCDRELTSKVVRVDPTTLERVDDHAIDPMKPDEKTPGLSGSAISIRYADVENADRLGEFALAATLPQNRDPECSSDAGCVVPDQFCEGTYSQCVLALAGRSADNGVVTTNNTGDFAASVYSYCEHDVNLALTRAFTLTVTPGGATPSVDYAFKVQFSPFMGDIPGPTRIGHDLCIPDWGAPVGVTLDLTAKAVTVLGSGDDAYRCCDVSCLPATAEDAAAVEDVPNAQSCDGRTSSGPRPSAIVDTALNDTLTPDDWLAADCLPPLRDGDGAIGGIRTAPIDCNAMDGTCFLPELAAGRDGTARDYKVRVEMPVGSFFRSFLQPLPVDGTDATARQEFKLDRRVFVRGRVLLGRDEESCAAAAAIDGDCGSEGAVVLAERLRMPDDGTPTLAPYFHQVSTYFDPISRERGNYILPLDPGVYLVTALPNSGSAGGPAKIEILDLRDGGDVDRDFILETGVIVTLDISEGFDPSTQVVPLDVRSWVNLDHPGRFDDPDPAKHKVDLNAPLECMSTTGDGRCRIRRLVASESITGSQVGRVRFTARPGAGSCPSCTAPQ